MNRHYRILKVYIFCTLSIIGISLVVFPNNMKVNIEMDEENISYIISYPERKPFESSTFADLPKKKDRINILFWNSYFEFSNFGMGLNNEGFLARECEFTNCFTSDNRSKWESGNMDAIIFHGLDYLMNLKEVSMLKKARLSGKINSLFVLFILESPADKKNFSEPVYKDFFDIVYSYRRDSEVYFPYGKVIPLEKPNKASWPMKKTKDIAWMVSHCQTHSKREDYVKELKSHLKTLKIDIFGTCGEKKLPKQVVTSNVSLIEQERLLMYHKTLKHYKFYLAFENSKCKDYITEKFFYSLSVPNILPIVRGANRSEYELVAPSKSFIHVDDFNSSKALANYLEKLNEDDEKLSTYHEWRKSFTVQVPYDIASCDFCKLLNQRTRGIEPIHDINQHWFLDKCIK